jgi:hypothetical protein
MYVESLSRNSHAQRPQCDPFFFGLLILVEVGFDSGGRGETEVVAERRGGVTRRHVAGRWFTTGGGGGAPNLGFEVVGVVGRSDLEFGEAVVAGLAAWRRGHRHSRGRPVGGESGWRRWLHRCR